MRRWLLLIVLLPNCTGCLAYAYPSLAYTPEVAVENRDGSAHAFRVDIDRTERTLPATPTTDGIGRGLPAPKQTQYTLTRIPIDRGGLIPSQLEIAPTTGVYDPFNVYQNVSHEKTNYTMTVRLYKPGSKTMEIQAWDKSKSVQWIAAPTLVEQEKAIDDLLADPAAPNTAELGSIPVPSFSRTWWDFKDQKSPSLGLQPGSASLSQRQFLQFAAGEYGRLANSPPAREPNMQAVRERLQQKAIWLQRYADQQGQ